MWRGNDGEKDIKRREKESKTVKHGKTEGGTK